ncbi:aminopeptidase [Paenibacillus koleovorans]|uniref:aminopeptidase n=1 Tax=Paenibacillus koleovorans TaxID=121608 RepID=UPI000FD961AF|nr:aminopeptidase [Paenibacillus koleovorans]
MSKTFEEQQNQYAELIVKVGLNLQQGQKLILMSTLATAGFARVIARTAYEAGARDVIVEWTDEQMTAIRMKQAPEEALDEFPAWKANGMEEMAAEGAALMQIYAPNPDLLKDADPARVSRATKARALAMQKFNVYTRTSRISWLIASVPTPDWAAKLFADIADEGERMVKLWDTIFSMNRVSEADPVEAWREHIAQLTAKREWLNDQAFRKLHYKGPGTDLTIGLPEKHMWVSAQQQNEKGVTYVPNLPTEEVFTIPSKLEVDGTVTSTMPLNHAGQVIDKFSLTFREGRIVDCAAEVGLEALKQLIASDEGSHYLGEVALVPDQSPISQSGIIFYNTLYDENASCHLAIGSAYPFTLKGGTEMTREQLDEAGANYSIMHVDFMIGSAELDIDGERADGTRLPVFRQGNWV